MRFLCLLIGALIPGNASACPIGSELEHTAVLYEAFANQLRHPRAQAYGSEIYNSRLRDALNGRIEVDHDYRVPKTWNDMEAVFEQLARAGSSHRERMAIAGIAAARLYLPAIRGFHRSLLNQGALKTDRFEQVVDSLFRVEEICRLDAEKEQNDELFQAANVIESAFRKTMMELSNNGALESEFARRYVHSLRAIREVTVRIIFEVVDRFELTHARNEARPPFSRQQTVVPFDQFELKFQDGRNGKPEELAQWSVSARLAGAIVDLVRAISGESADLPIFSIARRACDAGVYETIEATEATNMHRLLENHASQEFLRVWWLMVQARMAFVPPKHSIAE